MNELLKEYVDWSDAFRYIQPMALLYVAEVFALLWLAKWIHKRLSPYNPEKQLVHDDNKAFAVAFTGYLVGVGLVLHSVLSTEGSGQGLLADLGEVALWGLVGILLLNLARVVNDKLILYSFRNAKEILEDKNVGTGAVQLGSYLGTSFVLSAIIGQEGSGAALWLELAEAVVYFLVVQLGFVVFAWVYQKTLPYNLHKEVEKDNAAAGLSFGLTLVALGLVVAHPLRSTDNLAPLLVWFVNGTVLLLLSRLLVDRLLLSSVRVAEEITEDQNWGVAILEGSLAIIVALMLNVSFSF